MVHMKLRVVKKTLKNGEDIYYPEYRRFGFWHRYRYVDWCWSLEKHFGNLERAKGFIELKRQEREAFLKSRKSDGVIYKVTI